MDSKPQPIASDTSTSAAVLGTAARPRVLVVDDSMTILTFTASLLSHANCDVRTCNSIWISGDVAEFRPDLVLMDVNMGTSKGTCAVTALRDKAMTNGTLIVLHSSLPEDELQHLVDECGADGYIRKTQDPDSLLQQVSTYLPSPVLLSATG